MYDKFEYVDAISFKKKQLITDEFTERGYDPFLTNRHLSYFVDSVFYANDMNLVPETDKLLQFDYLLNTIRATKRFAKWHKQENDSDLKLVMEYYQISRQKAKQTLELLSKDQLNEIKQDIEKGGISK